MIFVIKKSNKYLVVRNEIENFVSCLNEFVWEMLDMYIIFIWMHDIIERMSLTLSLAVNGMGYKFESMCRLELRPQMHYIYIIYIIYIYVVNEIRIFVPSAARRMNRKGATFI